MALILIMHVMGCGLFIIPTIADAETDFRQEEGIMDKSVGLQYMFGIYWAAMVSHPPRLCTSTSCSYNAMLLLLLLMMIIMMVMTGK
jgi:hypothetical protein